MSRAFTEDDLEAVVDELLTVLNATYFSRPAVVVVAAIFMHSVIQTLKQENDRDRLHDPSWPEFPELLMQISDLLKKFAAQGIAVVTAPLVVLEAIEKAGTKH